VKIDLTMTTALRPEVLDATLWSIRENLVWDDGFNLIINLALVGGKYSIEDIRQVISRYFSDHQIRVKRISSSTDGLRWTWKKTQSEFVLQWEDDWVLREKVDLFSIINFMGDSVNMIFLDRHQKSVLDAYAEGTFTHIHSGFCKKMKNQVLVGSPALYRKSSIDQVVDLIDPLKQLGVNSASEQIQNIIKSWLVYAYTGASGRLVEDIGRAWMRKNNLVRVQNHGGHTWKEKL